MKTITEEMPETWEELCELAKPLYYNNYINVYRIDSLVKQPFSFHANGEVYCDDIRVKQNLTIPQMWAIIKALEE